jgi:DNA-binding transcriptional MocR family regulator
MAQKAGGAVLADGTLELFSKLVEERSARGIASALRHMITAGEIHQGDKLPTVRDLSASLGVSPATVAQAWQALAQAGMLITRGRAGTFVAHFNDKDQPPRFLGLGGPLINSGIDLSRGTPDPLLLPSISHAMERVTANRDIWTSSYFDEPVIPELDQLLRQSWPFRPDSLTVVDGALDGLSRIIAVLVSFGDRVIVESPGFPPLLDILERVGAEIIPIGLDEQGPLVSELADALVRDPVAAFLQPRAHNPTGTSMSQLRASEIAALLGRSACWIIEDDHSGDISTAPDVSIGQYRPDKTVHIRSFSKSHGPDLRLAAIGGASAVIEPLIRDRMLGPGWSSRLLQHILVELLTSDDSVSAVEHARNQYSLRSTHIREALLDSGLDPSPGDGINLFIPVEDEQRVLINLAAEGIRVAPGRPFFIGKVQSPGIRVTISALESNPDKIRKLARTIAQAVDRSEQTQGIR